jgi:anti-sigma regulatory factor (Ser/Thr protein kinase)
MDEQHATPGTGGSTVTPAAGGREPFVCTFMLETFVATRHQVHRYASDAGLTDLRLYNFVVAASEIMTNALQHGGGVGDVRVWVDEGNLYCEVVDRGPGMPGGRVNGFHRPDPGMIRGRGLWLARQICDQVDVQTGSSGTTVRLRYHLDGRS